jgi:nitric oxide dioxygenase
MELTREQVMVIKKTWAIFRDMEPRLVCDVFYGKLFYDNPPLRKLFPAEMDEQYAKLINMLNRIVGRLDQLDSMTAELQAMGKRHATYGVRRELYGPVGIALLWTLQQGLGADWNSQTKLAWQTCYAKIATIMQEAAQTP